MSNLHLWWGELLLDAFARAEVRQVVVSPGSRSTPLALAAHRHPHLTTTVVVDERCAAFVALGQARVTGRPSLLLCTSGTAGGHFFPAVMEASEANLPLLVLTADRPPEVQGRGALQTTRQSGLYGSFVRGFWELGVPDPHPAALAGVRAAAAMAVQATLDPRPGPVHLNAPFRPPLEPQPADPEDFELRRRVEVLLAKPVAQAAPPRRRASPELLDALAEAGTAAGRGIVVCGPGPLGLVAAAQPLTALATGLGFPVVAEAGSQLRLCRPSPSPLPMELLAGPEMPAHDFALVVGSWPTSAAWTQALTRAGAPPPWVLCEHGWVDPHNGAAGVVVGDVADSVQRLVERMGAGEPRDGRWRRLWEEVAACGAGVLEDAEEQERRSGRLSETGAVRVAVRCLPAGGYLALGNSLAIREVDMACPFSGVEIKVLTQRGVSGIDGGVSGAVGAALAGAAPLLLVTGDLAFQHDLGGLATAARVLAPLVILVLDNGGGRIFELLPLATSPVTEEEMHALFLTPQRVDVELAARAFGVAAASVTTVPELESALSQALTRPGCTVLRVVIDGGERRRRRQRLRETVQAYWRQVRP